MVAAETRGRVCAQQAAGNLQWTRVDDPSEVQRLHAEHAAKMQTFFSLVDPRNSLELAIDLVFCRKMEGVLCCARILRQNVHSFAKASVLAVSTTSSRCMATQSCK